MIPIYPCAADRFEHAPGSPFGACRTASNGKGHSHGTWLLYKGEADTRPEECRQMCADRSDCYAYETSPNRCELFLDGADEPIVNTEAVSSGEYEWYDCFLRRCEHGEPSLQFPGREIPPRWAQDARQRRGGH